MTVNVISLAIHLGCYIWLLKATKMKTIIDENYQADKEDRLELTEDQRKRWLEIYGHPLLTRTKKFARIAAQLQENREYLEKCVIPINNIEIDSTASDDLSESVVDSVTKNLEENLPSDIIETSKNPQAENLELSGSE